jgi:glycosyltransferase involved in cell wall biosynthesis
VRICAIVKYPPIEGGVSAQTYWMCRALAAQGHDVFVVTNADEVEPEYRAWFFGDDQERLQLQHPGAGSVRVRSSHAWDARQYSHVPAGNPSAAKLAAMATEVVREQDCDLILAFYLEPYGVAANLAAAWTGRPFAVRHSGSDRYRLMGHPDLGLAYKEVLRAATAVLGSGADLAAFGIPRDRVIRAPGGYIPPEFSPSASPLDLNALIRQLSAEAASPLLNSAELTALPVLGVYGKFGPQKGTLDLLRAVAALRERGTDLQLVMLGGGTSWPAVQAAIRDYGIADVTWRLPFIAPWRVPSFIRACDAVCFLEHGFDISEHRPGVAGEVMACGTPLIVSGEIAAKQPAAAELADGKNCYIVPDPGDLDTLTAVIGRALADKAASSRVGLAAAALMTQPAQTEVGSGYEKALTQCLEIAGVSSTPASQREPLRAVVADRNSCFRAELEEFLRARCPATVSLAAERLPGLLDQAAQAARARPVSAPLAAYRLCAELAGSLSPAAARQPAGQFCLIERNLLWFRVDDEGTRGVASYRVPVHTTRRLPADGADVVGLRPVTSRLVRVERLSVDVAAYARALKSSPGQMAPGPAGPEYAVLFHKYPQLGGTVRCIDGRTAELLGLCTGERSVGAILTALGTKGPSAAKVVRLIGEMLHGRLLALAAGSAAGPRDERGSPLVSDTPKAE